MIAFGCAITSAEAYERYAKPGIDLAAEPDSKVLAHASTGSIFRNYNLLLDLARPLEDLEALVLIHQDAEIVDPDFCAKLRAALVDPAVAIVGCAGALDVRSIAWWEGTPTWASLVHRYDELGGGEIPPWGWDPEDSPPYASTGQVDSIDGFVMALSPWAVRELRFDESLGTLHGYDFDICAQARVAGKKVVTTDLRMVHHHSIDTIGDEEAWIQAHVTLAEKWEGRLPNVGAAPGDWKARARRAEAEAAVARARATMAELLRDNCRKDLAVLQGSTSWRLTAPGRWLGRLLRGRRAP